MRTIRATPPSHSVIECIVDVLGRLRDHQVYNITVSLWRIIMWLVWCGGGRAALVLVGVYHSRIHLKTTRILAFTFADHGTRSERVTCVECTIPRTTYSQTHFTKICWKSSSTDRISGSVFHTTHGAACNICNAFETPSCKRQISCSRRRCCCCCHRSRRTRLCA